MFEQNNTKNYINAFRKRLLWHLLLLTGILAAGWFIYKRTPVNTPMTLYTALAAISALLITLIMGRWQAQIRPVGAMSTAFIIEIILSVMLFTTYTLIAPPNAVYIMFVCFCGATVNNLLHILHTANAAPVILRITRAFACILDCIIWLAEIVAIVVVIALAFKLWFVTITKIDLYGEHVSFMRVIRTILGDEFVQTCFIICIFNHCMKPPIIKKV